MAGALAAELRPGVQRAAANSWPLWSPKVRRTFPKLPLREGENVLVAVLRFADPAVAGAYRDGAAAQLTRSAELVRHLAGPVNTLRLRPMARSLLR